jgi:hypothetical protein
MVKVKFLPPEVRVFRESGLTVTINTNKTQRAVSRDVFIGAMTEFSNNIELFFVCKNKGDKVNLFPFLPEKAGDTKVSFNYEIGGKYHRVHSHMTIVAKTTTRYVHLNVPLMHNFFTAKLGFPVYINVKSFVTNKSVRDYLTK